MPPVGPVGSAPGTAQGVAVRHPLWPESLKTCPAFKRQLRVRKVYTLPYFCYLKKVQKLFIFFFLFIFEFCSNLLRAAFGGAGCIAHWQARGPRTCFLRVGINKGFLEPVR